MSADNGPPPSEAMRAVAVRQLHAPSARNFTARCLILRMRAINNVARVLHYARHTNHSVRLIWSSLKNRDPDF